MAEGIVDLEVLRLCSCPKIDSEVGALKLEDCNLDLKAVGMAPFIRTEPEDYWITARNEGAIPLSLFDLYRRANYLSFGSSPRFLRDENHILFSYFALMLKSLASSLVDADNECREFIASNKEGYYIGKRLDDPSWTKAKSEEVGKRTSEAFRSLLISLHASLDALAEIVAIFSQGSVKRLKVGLAQFTSIETWLEGAPIAPSVILSPQDVYLSDLHSKLRPIIYSTHPETDWLPYLRLLRNKAAHLGDGPFRSTVLTGKDGSSYRFIPRHWPYIWEKYMKPEGEIPSMTLPELLLKTHIHQDVEEYATGALCKIRQVVAEACTLTGKAYTEFSDFGFNEQALSELTANSKEFKFERFI